MSKRYPKARYELPETINPDRICMSVMVPDDPFHIAAFRGALLTLASARSWANDTGHTALEVAAVWDEIYQEVSDCIMALMDVRQNEELPCKLEKTENGEDWVEFADLQLCPPRLRTSKGKMQWFDGSAWVDLPGGGDERFDGEADPQWVDPPEGESGSCLAAENIIASYVTMLTQTKAGLDAVATISGIVDVVAGYIGTQTLFPPALLILNISLAVGALATLGSGAIEDLIDSPNVGKLKCIIKCHASSDGAFTAAEFDAIKDDVDLQIDNPEKLIMTEWLNSYGPVGLTRAAAANGIIDGSCGDCITCLDCATLQISRDEGTIVSGPDENCQYIVNSAAGYPPTGHAETILIGRNVWPSGATFHVEDFIVTGGTTQSTYWYDDMGEHAGDPSGHNVYFIYVVQDGSTSQFTATFFASLE